MKRTFIRCVFGDCTDTSKKLNAEIKEIAANPYNTEYIVYTWGKNNADYLTTLNINARLVSDNPWYWNSDIGLRHKIESYRIAMEEDGFDEIVFLDWDTIPQKKLPDDFWDQMYKKAAIQSCSYSFAQIVCPWRKTHQRTTVNSNFLYLRNKTYPQKIIEAWGKMKEVKKILKGRSFIMNYQHNDEYATSYFIDEINNGWIGLDKYWELHEPMFVNLSHKSTYDKNLLNQKNQCFLHKWL